MKHLQDAGHATDTPRHDVVCGAGGRGARVRVGLEVVVELLGAMKKHHMQCSFEQHCRLVSRCNTIQTNGELSASPWDCPYTVPMHGCPAMMAMVAGVAPCCRTTSSTSRAVCRFCGYGMPTAAHTIRTGTLSTCNTALML